mgnify:CR=1 FL=1
MKNTKNNENGYWITKTRIKESATPIDNITKFAWADDDYEKYKEWHEYTQEELDNMEKVKAENKFKENVPARLDKIESDIKEIKDILLRLKGE